MKITVVGAGVVGCAIAHELASRGAHVRVVDPRGTGRGATYASAGMLAPYIEGHVPALRALAIRSLSLYDAFVDRLRVETGQPVEYERTGTLQVARGDDEAAQLREDAARLAAEGVAVSVLSPADLRRLSTPPRPLTDDVSAGLLIPAHGYVVVPALVDALVAAARAAGAEFLIDRVVGIHDTGAGARVATMDRAIDSDVVIVAAGSWTGQIPALRDATSASQGPSAVSPPVKPIRGQLLRLVAGDRAAPQVLWGSGCYIVPWRNGTTLVGATVEDVGFDERPTAAAIHDLLVAALALVPGLRGAVFEDVRVGLRPMTADELPIIGPSSTMPHVFYATGHYRNGILLTPLTAAVVADYLLDGRLAAELEVTRPSRFGL